MLIWWGSIQKFDWTLQLSSGQKWKKCEKNIAIYSHALLNVAKLLSEHKLVTDKLKNHWKFLLIILFLQITDTKLFGNVAQNVLYHT